MVKTQVFQLPWVWVVVRSGEIVLGDGALGLNDKPVAVSKWSKLRC